MKLNKLASVILRSTWLIEKEHADALLPIAERFLKGEKVNWFDNENKADEVLIAQIVAANNSKVSYNADSSTGDNIYDNVPDQSIAVIPVQGTILKDDNCGSPGTDTLSAWLKSAVNSPNIIGAVLDINSPGGQVQGTAEFAEVIAWASTQMPVEVYTDGMLCSAAYWLASGCYITASSGTVEIGSIGTAATYRDWSAGSSVKTHYITADKSVHKNNNSIQALKGNYAPLKQNILNPTNEIFLQAVMDGRGDKLQLTDVKNDDDEVITQEPLSAEVYLAQAAIDNGLIDAIGNFDSVLARIRANAGNFSPQNQPNNNNMSLFGSNFKKLAAIKSKKAAEVTEEEIKAVNEEFVAEGYSNVVVISTAHLAEADANADAIENGLTAINAVLGKDNEKTSLTEAISALVALHGTAVTSAADWKKKADEYGDQPGEKPTKVKTDAKSEGAAPGAEKTNKKFETSADRELEELKAKMEGQIDG